MKVTEKKEEMVTLVLIGLVVWAVAIWLVSATVPRPLTPCEQWKANGSHGHPSIRCFGR